MGCACYSSKGKDDTTKMTNVSRTYTPVAPKGKNTSEQNQIFNILSEDLRIDELYCQQIYDVFRFKILETKLKPV